MWHKCTKVHQAICYFWLPVLFHQQCRRIKRQIKMVLSERVLDSYRTWLGSLSASARQEDGKSRSRRHVLLLRLLFPFYWSHDVKSWGFITFSILFFFSYVHKAQVKQQSAHASGDYCQFADHEIFFSPPFKGYDGAFCQNLIFQLFCLMPNHHPPGLRVQLLCGCQTASFPPQWSCYLPNWTRIIRKK